MLPAIDWSMDDSFDGVLARHRLGPLRRRAVRTLQVNLGKLCNQACHHCHVDAGPKRIERMQRPVAERVIEVLRASPLAGTLDITGGAPELNENFPYLVRSARAMGRRVIVRCNLTVIFAPGMESLPRFYRDHGVELICSLPCYTAENVDKQRGAGVFDKSIDALRILNGLGYGTGEWRLDLVYNPVGAFLPGEQSTLEARYREELRANFAIEFDHLLTLTNMPIKRFAEHLRRAGAEREYMALLVNHFNPATVARVMCREMVSVGYDGALYDCDFNQMLEMPLGEAQLTNKSTRPPREERTGRRIFDLEDLSVLDGLAIETGPHCFGCTAGAGSSCSGALTAK